MSEKFFLLYRHQAPQCNYCKNPIYSTKIVRASSVEDALTKISQSLIPENWNVRDLEYKEYKKYLDDIILNTYLLDPSEADNIGAYDHGCFEMILYECDSQQNVLPLFRQKISEIRDFQKTLDQKIQNQQDLEEYNRLKRRMKDLERKLGIV